MENKYATKFGAKFSHDVVNGKAVYIINLYGKDGCLAVGDNKKKTCEIRGDTFEEAKKKGIAITNLTKSSHAASEKVLKELGQIRTKAVVDKGMSKYKYVR